MSSKTQLSDLALANVEALAYELPDFTITCSADCVGAAVCWSTNWSYGNFDAWCYWTGYENNVCYANKC